MSQSDKLTHQVVEQWFIAVSEKNLGVEGEDWHIAIQPEPGATHQSDLAIEAQPVLQVGGGQIIGIQLACHRSGDEQHALIGSDFQPPLSILLIQQQKDPVFSSGAAGTCIPERRAIQ